jgi:UDP-N-acetylmuramate dehydrogenase
LPSSPPPDALGLAEFVPLAAFTTLQLGGPARWLLTLDDAQKLEPALRWARDAGVRVLVLGGGSNVIVPDEGFDGLVILVRTRGVHVDLAAGRARVEVAAGEPWDAFVARTVEERWAGLECLSGIPGTVGAAPIQNIGAYGAELAERLVGVHARARSDGRAVWLAPGDLELGYRASALKRSPDAYVVERVVVDLDVGGAPQLRYAELTRAAAARGLDAPSLHDARALVLELRRGKSMVWSPDDPNRRSVGSFFTNPVVPAALHEEVTRRALALGVVRGADEVPAWPQPDGRMKLSAAWLIERAGISRGLRRGAVGVSSRHTLALVHHGGGTSAALLALAEEVRAAVRATFAVELEREAVWLGPSA